MNEVVVASYLCACCPERVQQCQLMCRVHWRLVPDPLQKEVNRTYRALSSSGPKWAWRAIADYERARSAAIGAVRAQLSTQANQGGPTP